MKMKGSEPARFSAFAVSGKRAPLVCSGPAIRMRAPYAADEGSTIIIFSCMIGGCRKVDGLVIPPASGVNLFFR